MYLDSFNLVSNELLKFTDSFYSKDNYVKEYNSNQVFNFFPQHYNEGKDLDYLVDVEMSIDTNNLSTNFFSKFLNK